MKFRVTKIAAAVATGLGVSVVGMNAAQADALLFPYFAVGGSVTTLVSVTNLAAPWTAAPERLHYRFYYKNGDNTAVSDAGRQATCDEFDVRRITSQNDTVTFDISGHFGDDLGILYEPKANQVRAAYQANQTFALMEPLSPARGVLIVENENFNRIANGNNTDPFEGSMFGEALVVDFSNGAAWGYTAYNAASAVNTADVLQSPAASTEVPVNPRVWPAPVGAVGYEGLGYDFSARNATAGEVIAGTAVASLNAPNGARSPIVPTTIPPVAGFADDTEEGITGITTRFFVTPIAHNALVQSTNPAAWWQASATSGDTTVQYQLNQDKLTTRIGLTVATFSQNSLDVVYDRDETPVSGQLPRTVTCVGAVDAWELVSEGVRREWATHGGWTAVQISSPGPLVTWPQPGNLATGFDAATAATRPQRTLNVNQAIVQKLEFNTAGRFAGQAFGNASGSYNNALWLRTPGLADGSAVTFPLNGVCPVGSFVLNPVGDDALVAIVGTNPICTPVDINAQSPGSRTIQRVTQAAPGGVDPGLTFLLGGDVVYQGQFSIIKKAGGGYRTNQRVPSAFPAVNASSTAN